MGGWGEEAIGNFRGLQQITSEAHSQKCVKFGLILFDSRKMWTAEEIGMCGIVDLTLFSQ